MYYELTKEVSSSDGTGAFGYPKTARTEEGIKTLFDQEVAYLVSIFKDGELTYPAPNRAEMHYKDVVFSVQYQHHYEPLLRRVITEPREDWVLVDNWPVKVTVHRSWATGGGIDGGKRIALLTVDDPDLDLDEMTANELAEFAEVAGIDATSYSGQAGQYFQRFPWFSDRFGGIVVEQHWGYDV